MYELKAHFERQEVTIYRRSQACIMPRGDPLGTQGCSKCEEGIKLDVAVAGEVWVWGQPSTALHKILDSADKA
jgi:hypothetical protein